MNRRKEEALQIIVRKWRDDHGESPTNEQRAGIEAAIAALVCEHGCPPFLCEHVGCSRCAELGGCEHCRKREGETDDQLRARLVKNG